MAGEGVTMERTVAIIKPDAVRRRLVGKIISAIEDCNFSITHIQICGGWEFRDFYARQHEDAPYFEELVKFMESGPSIGMILVREDGILSWRGLMNTLRAQYKQPQDRICENLVHGSDSYESYVYEVSCLEM